MKTPAPNTDAIQRRANLRLALILVSLVVVFALGFVAKIALFSH
jgi:hypothetical protein